MKKSLVDYLIHRYDLNAECDVRYIDPAQSYAEGAIECYGQMPNSTEIDWFFAGFERDIEREIDRG